LFQERATQIKNVQLRLNFFKALKAVAFLLKAFDNMLVLETLQWDS
jgi:hypothetical protein